MNDAANTRKQPGDKNEKMFKCDLSQFSILPAVAGDKFIIHNGIFRDAISGAERNFNIIKRKSDGKIKVLPDFPKPYNKQHLKDWLIKELLSNDAEKSRIYSLSLSEYV
jgi:hypothetical protein